MKKNKENNIKHISEVNDVATKIIGGVESPPVTQHQETMIHGIFPTPVYTSSIKRAFTIEEKKFIQENLKRSFPNLNNVTSWDTNILETKEMENLKKEMLFMINDFYDKVFSPVNREEISPYITQSWLNWTSPGQSHHKHNHPNSILSGVLYIDADDKHDRITLYNENYNTIRFEPKDTNVFNANSGHVIVKTGSVVIFPSNVWHSVDTKAGNNLRISLAFNTFVKGTFGSERQLYKITI
jgi:uncharacterized protein (TIGR02466 family)